MPINQESSAIMKRIANFIVNKRIVIILETITSLSLKQ